MAVLAGENDFSDQNVSPTDSPGEDLELGSVLEDILDLESEYLSTRKRTDEDYTTLISGQKLQDPGKDQQMIVADFDDPLPFEDIKRQSPIYDSSLCPVDYQPYVGTSEPQDSEFGEKLWLNAKNHSPPQIPPQIVDDGALKNPVYTDQEKAAVQERRRKRVSVLRDTKTKNVYVRKMSKIEDGRYGHYLKNILYFEIFLLLCWFHGAK
ncbi:uncharacterized protein LOC117343420 [Pecten maximus]|uniref:uncharacterized protein LOC117343420 n=1 Tax=Pecten maximus TaxID=6579 RepID=UPI00145884C1|nr:uncharacterized protein LOC117343420 [Pecten maximus]